MKSQSISLTLTKVLVLPQLNHTLDTELNAVLCQSCTNPTIHPKHLTATLFPLITVIHCIQT